MVRRDYGFNQQSNSGCDYSRKLEMDISYSSWNGCNFVMWHSVESILYAFSNSNHFIISAQILINVDTEIDWTAYMQQIETYLKGERDYEFIQGDTGPLVYPGLHVYIYRVLHILTDHGKNIFAAQVSFMILYLASLIVVMACYRQAKVSCNLQSFY